MNLTKDLSEDTSAGRLILSSCSTVLLSKPKIGEFSGRFEAGFHRYLARFERRSKIYVRYCVIVDSDSENKEVQEKESSDKDSERIVYEALIEDKGKNAIYLRLSAYAVQALNLKVNKYNML